MKYVVVVIFKNQMKLEKSFKTKEQAVEVARKLGEDMVNYAVSYFADTYFCVENVLCVSWYRIPKQVKEEVKEYDKN